MYNPRFDKQTFKREVTENVKTLFRKTIEEATRSSYTRRCPMR